MFLKPPHTISCPVYRLTSAHSTSSPPSAAVRESQRALISGIPTSRARCPGGRTDGWRDGGMDGWMDGGVDGGMEGWMGAAVQRSANDCKDKPSSATSGETCSTWCEPLRSLRQHASWSRGAFTCMADVLTAAAEPRRRRISILRFSVSAQTHLQKLVTCPLKHLWPL